jgi:hypothetical protein
MEEAGEGRGVILTRCGTVKRLWATHYSTDASTCHSIVPQASFRAQNCPKPRIAFKLREKEKGQGQ